MRNSTLGFPTNTMSGVPGASNSFLLPPEEMMLKISLQTECQVDHVQHTAIIKLQNDTVTVPSCPTLLNDLHAELLLVLVCSCSSCSGPSQSHIAC